MCVCVCVCVEFIGIPISLSSFRTHTYTHTHSLSQDTLTLETALDTATHLPLPFILALSRRVHHRSLHLCTPDLLHYTTLFPPDSTTDTDTHTHTHTLPPPLSSDTFVIYTDNVHVLPVVLSHTHTHTLTQRKQRELFQSLHVTDLNTRDVG